MYFSMNYITLSVSDKSFQIRGRWSYGKVKRDRGEYTDKGKDGRFWYFTFIKQLVCVDQDIADNVETVIPGKLLYDEGDEYYLAEDSSKLNIGTDDLEYDDNGILGVWSLSNREYVQTY